MINKINITVFFDSSCNIKESLKEKKNCSNIWFTMIISNSTAQRCFYFIHNFRRCVVVALLGWFVRMIDAVL